MALIKRASAIPARAPDSVHPLALPNPIGIRSSGRLLPLTDVRMGANYLQARTYGIALFPNLEVARIYFV